MNTNQRAIELYENNCIDEAFKAFQLAVKESRNVQSLTNLAWIYYHEKENTQKAIELLNEVLQLTSSSHFPFNLLGEIYLERKEWEEAAHILLQSINIAPTPEALNNLGVAKYHLGELHDASEFFLKGSTSRSDYSLYNHIKCLIELNKTAEAKKILESFVESNDEFVGNVEVAELYLEMNDYNKALLWFEKGWNEYYKQPEWVERYIYALIKSNQMETAEEKLKIAMAEKQSEIEDCQQDECNEAWTQIDKEMNIQRLNEEFMQYNSLLERIFTGYIPKMNFTTSLFSACYLFGCVHHNHLEYGKEG